MLVYVYNCPMIAIVSSFTIAVAVQRHLLQASVEMTVDPSVSEAPGIDAVARRLLHAGVSNEFYSRIAFNNISCDKRARQIAAT